MAANLVLNVAAPKPRDSREQSPIYLAARQPPSTVTGAEGSSNKLTRRDGAMNRREAGGKTKPNPKDTLVQDIDPSRYHPSGR